MTLFSELRRRKVFQVGLAYLAASWLLVEVVSTLFDIFGAPVWVIRALVGVLAVGFPVALILSWAYQLTPEGLKRQSDLDRQGIQTDRGRRVELLAIGLVTVTVAFILLQLQFAPEPEAPEAAVPDQARAPIEAMSIAVLPFVNMSADEENEYFADGLSEELLNQLSQVPGLLVSARTSSFSFKGKNQDLREIGDFLGVANILEGSVRRSQDQVRVTAQLIRAEDGFHMWSNSYDRLMDDIFAIQDDISASVTRAMKIVLDEQSRARMEAISVRNVDAFIAYQKARELHTLAHSGEVVGPDFYGTLEESNIYLDQATDLAPDFASAYWMKMDHFFHKSATIERDQYPEILAAIRGAVAKAHEYAVDPQLRALAGLERVYWSDDWSTFRDRAEKALTTQGCNPPMHSIQWLLFFGYAEEVLRLYDHWTRCDPLDNLSPGMAARAEILLGRPEDALARIEVTEKRFGHDMDGYRAKALLALGRIEEALSEPPNGPLDEIERFALEGRVDDAMAIWNEGMEMWTGTEMLQKFMHLTVLPKLGQRETVNEVAAWFDQRAAGHAALVQFIECLCGPPFDLEATPSFAQRVAESGLVWPPARLIDYPAKDW